MNLDQKHFPMLREYEKAKMQMINYDLSEDNSVRFDNTTNTFAQPQPSVENGTMYT